MYEDAEVFQSNILESRQAEHAAEVIAAEERARVFQKQKKVRLVVLVTTPCRWVGDGQMLLFL